MRSRPVSGVRRAPLSTASLLTASLSAASLLAACEDPTLSSHQSAGELRAIVEPFGLQPEVADEGLARLAWHEPAKDCRQVYRIETSYDPELQFEPASDSVLVVGPATESKARPEPGVTARLDHGEIENLRTFYRGFRAEKRGVTRDMHLSASFAGPAAPTAACTPKTWDPVEDALALGWPRLTERWTAIGEAWTGLPVGGRCNRSACVNLEDGPARHDLACMTPAWRETLLGIYEIGGESFALLRATWSDGNVEVDTRTVQPGVWTERLALVSLEHGRPAWARAFVHYGFGVPMAGGGLGATVRRWELTAIDACPGSLATVGWERPAELVARTEEAIASFEASSRGDREAAFETAPSGE